ncbi:MAG: DUF3306 domain-containing protein [Betaproteobacteria bacterium HGW-Betaproteobacteria-3]|jgi:hypothetical protein|nr:MAG: DUF3306 domain-containing protein [Betaproteobacteria bacterium HGW-Betaproteobacteria-3]
MADGFLGRWSRRKIDALQGKPPQEPPPAPASPVPAAPAVAAVNVQDARSLTPADGDEAATGTPETPAAPPPTLEDAQSLTPESDFKPFMTRGVTSEVKNAAMKKLFADPHFNVMDGLDIYIDDYNQFTPLPAASLAKMASAKFLGLVEDDEAPDPSKDAATHAPPTAATETPMPRDDADTAAPQSVAQSDADAGQPAPPALPAEPSSLPASPLPTSTAASPTDHAHTDLRLQPDDAAPVPSPRQGAG